MSAKAINGDTSFCPDYYGMEPNLDGDSRTWYAGYAGVFCNWILFPPIATSGTYDDYPSTFINYTGPWTHSQGWPLTWNHTVSWSNIFESKEIFSFNGTNISRIYTMAYNRGLKEIYLDGSYYDTSTDYAPTIRWQVIKTWEVEPGDHTIQVVVNSNYIDQDAFIVNLIPPGSGTYDDFDTELTFGGNWTHSYGWPYAWNGTESWSNTIDDFMRITFRGSEIIYYYEKVWNRGKAAITIDGVDYGMIDLYSQTPIWQFSSSYYLGPGIHTFHLSIPRQKNPLSTDYYVDIDRIDIIP